jgi:hypothetical protein
MSKKLFFVLMLILAVAVIAACNGVSDTEYEADVANGANETDEVDEVVLSEQDLSMFGESAMALPVFSHSAGVYAQSFYLELSAEEGATIHFTLDGSIPTQHSPVYSSPLYIHAPEPTEENSPLTMGMSIGRGGGDLPWQPGLHYYRGWWWRDNWPVHPRPYYNGMVVRARVFDESGDATDVVTQSFFVERDGRGAFNTRIISISLNSDDFLHPETGMYFNWYDRSLRPMAYAEVFYPDGTLMLSQAAQARVPGNWSRRHPLKSLRLDFSRGPGIVLDQPDLIPNTRQSYYTPSGEITDFRHVSMRISDWDRSTIRDTLASAVNAALRPDSQNATYGAVFVNGEFWGMYEFREHRSAQMLAARYPGLNPDSIVVLEVAPGSITNNQVLSPDDPLYPWAGEDGRLPVNHPLTHVEYDVGSDEFECEAYASWMSVVDAIRGTDMSVQANFEHVKTLVCMDNLIDYFLMFYHFDNWDWPGNNFLMWRTENYYPDIPAGDTRWRFFIHDFDESLNEPHFDRTHHFTTTGREHVAEPEWASAQDVWAVEFWYNLFQNAEFRSTLSARYSTYTGTVFHTSRVNAIIDRLAEYRRPTISSHFYRWRLDERQGREASRWFDEEGHWDGVWRVREVLNRRADYSLDHLRGYFNRTDRANLGLDLDITGFTNIRWLLDPSMGWFDISGAQIRADLFPSIADYAFHIGDFNAEYIRGLPITVTAMPLDGYSFSHFAVSGGINGIFDINPMVITPPANNDAPIVVEAVFE